MLIIGILIGLYLKISIAFLCMIYGIIIILTLIWIRKKIVLIFIFIILISSVYVKLLDQKYEEKYTDIPDTITARAIVISEPIEEEYKYKCNIEILEINKNSNYKGIKLIININKNKVEDKKLRFGDEIELEGEYIEPNEARNYKGFDYKAYLKSKGIYGTIKVASYEICAREQTNKMSKLINKIQNNMKRNINTILNKEESALCIGILIGDREAISEETETNFKNSNLTHMLAVSGSHITYIINGLALMLSKTGKRTSKIVTICILVFFMALTGFTASVIRACIMGILVLIASLIKRKSDTINNLGISSIIILVANPYSINDVGFLLSYGGTIGIVLFGDRINNFFTKKIKKMVFKTMETTSEESNITSKEEKSISKKAINKIMQYAITSFSITISANLVIIPIMAYNFSTFSFTFWISNILAGPIMEIVTVLGFILYFISLVYMPIAGFMGQFLNILLDILLKIAEFSSQIPGASIYIKTPYLWECAFYYVLLGIIFNYKIVKRKMTVIFNFFKKKIASLNRTISFFRICIVLIIIPIIFLQIREVPLKIYFVDVGQGDCTLIQTPSNKTILIDGGGSEFGNFDVGESTLLPYLLDRRIKKIDYILISHFDSDHIGGLFAIIENLKVGNIIISKQGEKTENLKKFANLLNSKKTNLLMVKKGDLLRIDKNTYFEILFPEDELIEENILNNNSIVANFHYKDFSMLFTGDIEQIAEKRLCDLYKDTNKLKATVLKVAHHGSKTSSTEEFLELVKPKIALIGVGENNSFGHPNDIVINRLKNYTNFIFRTDEYGEIVIEKNNKSCVIDNKIR